MSVVASLDPENETIWLRSDWRWRDQIRSVPGTKWSVDKGMWYLPCTWAACLALRGTLGENLQIGDSLKDWAVAEKLNRIDPALVARNAAEWPAGDPKLFWWQRSGAEFISRGKQIIIADDPGCGKTATAIRGLAQIQAEGENVFPILVVCPTAVKQSWAREFEQWWPGLKTQVVKGTVTQRRKQLATPAHVYVMNIESIRSHSRLAPYGSIAMKRCPEHGGEDPTIKDTACHVHPKELNSMKFNSVVLDECHRVKEGKAIQTRAIKAAAGDAKFRIALSGTPIANDVTDLWSILNFLSPREFPSKTKFIERYVEVMPNAFGGMVVIGIRADRRAEFDAVLEPRMRRMSEDQVLTFLPPITYKRRYCEMTGKQAKAYKDMQKSMITELESGTLMAGTPMTNSMRLLQFASSYAEVDSHEEEDEYGFKKVVQKMTLTDPSTKLDAFIEDLEMFGKDQVAVMAVSRQLLELLSKRLDKLGIKHGMITGKMSEDEKQWAIDDFQAGRTKFILFTAAAGGTGVTLTAAKYLARLQLPYSFINYKQTLRRVRRIGSEIHDHIFVIDYITEDTLDSHCFVVVAEKEENFEDVVKDKEALLRMLKE